MEPIIIVKGLGKKYTIHHQKGGYITLRDIMTNSFKKPVRFLKAKAKKFLVSEKKEPFWALKNVNFQVMPGEVIGIIGRNGAGKSTLLKILSQITPPTTGEIQIHGTVGSLLEVGTGFHPELTGRENIFLNGAILGMKKAEITKKFDEIVAFAGIEKFLDTPVKYYSSGMYVRLAFSVAAHMDTDILIIDEVLAVGDADFQKKCLNKMNEITRTEGRTILFVSHDTGAIRQLCNKVILIEKGEIINFSKTQTVLDQYFESSKSSELEIWENKNNDFQNDYFEPKKFYLSKDSQENQWINIEGLVKNNTSDLTIGYAIYSENGTLLYWSYQTDTKEDEWPRIKKGHLSMRSKVPTDILNTGFYKIELITSLYFKEWLIAPGKNSPAIFLDFNKKFNKSKYWTQKRPGVLAITNLWEIN